MIKELFQERGRFKVTLVGYFKFHSMKDPIEILWENDVTSWRLCCNNNTKVGIRSYLYCTEFVGG